MNKGLKHTVTSWITIVSFLVFSIATPTLAYADEPATPAPPAPSPSLSVDLDSCSIIGIPTLQLTLPQIGSTGQIYAVGGTSRYRLYDTSTNQQLTVEGTLLDKPAAASLLVSLQNVENLWQIELNRVLSYNNACWQYRLSLAQAEVTSRDTRIVALTDEMNNRLRIRNEHIDFLNQNNRPTRWYESGEFWFAVGLVAGIGLTVGAGYALGQANN